MYHLLGSSQQPQNVGVIIISIVKMIKLRLSEIMYFAQGHTQEVARLGLELTMV